MRRSYHRFSFKPLGTTGKIKVSMQRVSSLEVTPKFCAWCSSRLQKKFIPVEGNRRLWCTGCGFITYLNPYPVAGVIAHRNGKVLLLKRGIAPAKGKWTFPAGFVELGESIQQAALRETLEETRMKVKLTGLVGCYSYPGFGVVTIVYSAELLSGRFKPCMETEAVAEFSTDSIPWKELAFRSTRDALQDWLKR